MTWDHDTRCINDFLEKDLEEEKDSQGTSRNSQSRSYYC